MSAKGSTLFVTECYIDTAVLRAALGRDPSHVANNAAVAQQMERMEQRKPGTLVIGMTDDDEARKVKKRNEPPYFRQFELAAHAEGLLFLRHPRRNHFLIKVRPACDAWLHDCALRAELQPKAFGFASDHFDDFKDVTKREGADRDERVRLLLKAVYRAQRGPFLQLLEFIRQFEAPPQWMLDQEAQ